MKMLVGLGLFMVSIAAIAVPSTAIESDNAIILAVEVAVIVAVAFAVGAWVYLSRQKF